VSSAPASVSAPQPAALGAYFPQLEFLDLLGQGGMGAVFRAQHMLLKKDVALKVIASNVAGDLPSS